MDINSRKVSKSAMERFSAENGVKARTMRWVGRPRPSGQHALVVVKVATNEDVEKLLQSDSMTFGGGRVVVSLFKEQRTPIVCFKCRKFGHGARDCRSQRCQIFAVLSRVITGDAVRELIICTFQATDLPKCSYALWIHAFEAVAKLGLLANMFLTLIKPWVNMVEGNLTTWAEDY